MRLVNNVRDIGRSIKRISKASRSKDQSLTKLVVKNAGWQFSTNIIAKLGSLIFTIIIARLLMPKLFGLYSLALSTIVMFAAFTDMGVSSTLVRFLSRALAKKDKTKAKSYVVYLTKIKLWLTLITAIVLAASAKFIAISYYHKPIYLALLAGSLYILCISFVGFITSFFQAANNFKHPFFKELFFQIMRLTVLPILIILILSNGFSLELGTFVIILGLAFIYFLTLIFIFTLTRRKLNFLHVKPKTIKPREKKRINKFILALSATVLSGIFFGYIDMIMLGHFVLAEFIGYYRAAFSLIGGIAPLIAFSAVLFPVFSRIKGKRLERGLRKAVKVTSFLAVVVFALTLAFAPLIIKIVYGKDYTTAVPLLRLLSLLLISLPLTSIYSSYMIARGKPQVVAKLLIGSTIINIALNYIFIIWLLHYSQFLAVVGASIATIISRYLYMVGLMKWKR